MKAIEIREKTVDELNQSLSDLKTELFNLRFQLATGELSDPNKIKSVKKNIARVKTVLKERELNINVQ